MNLIIRTHPGRSSRAGLIATALVSALTLTLPMTALAQEASAEPASRIEPAGIAFPVMLGGQLLTAETYTGPDWLAQFSEGESEDTTFVEGTEALVAGVGKTLDDLTVKSALYTPSEGEHAVVAAFRIDGVEGREFVEDTVQLLLGDVPKPELLMRPLGTKWILRVTSAEMPGVYPRTVYVVDDTVWVIEGDEDYVWDALDQLPDPAPLGVTPGDSLISEVPLSLDGRRRTGLYEATEPLFLPAMEQYLGPEIEPWLLELYLESGISPAEMLGVIAWWGIESVEESVQIEGYRLPQGAEGSVESLRADIFLGGEGEAAGTVLEGVTQIEQEIAGRTVTTLDYTPPEEELVDPDMAALDYAQPTQHIFSSASGDTVWVVTDYVGETAMVEEAIAALP